MAEGADENTAPEREEERPGLGPWASVFDDATVAILNSDLDRARVKKREGRGGGEFSYLEGHDVKRTANRIFGFGRWGYEVVELVELSAVEVSSKYKKAGWHVGYRAVVRLTVAGCMPVTDVGYGDGVEYGWSETDPGASRVTGQELAMKEAVTDGLKRALVAFGDQFGLVLYEKDEGAARLRRDQNADESTGRPSDTPMSVKACMDRLETWVLDPVPWVREAYFRLYDEKLEGAEAGMDQGRRIRLIGGLQNVAAFLDANAPSAPPAGAEEALAAAYVVELQAAVRAGFAAAFEGHEVLGPDPFALPHPVLMVGEQTEFCAVCGHGFLEHLPGGCAARECECGGFMPNPIPAEQDAWPIPTLEAVPVPVLVAAAPGWHAVVINDEGEPKACPVVAWAVAELDGAQTLEPFIYGPADAAAPTVWRPVGDQWERIASYVAPGLALGGPLRDALTVAARLRARAAEEASRDA